MAARTVQKLRLLAGTAVASTFALPVVYATGNGSGEVRIIELPIYDPLPSKEKYEFVPHEPNSLEKGIGSLRTSLAEYKQSVDSFIDKVSYKWEVSKAHTLSLIDYIQNDPSILPRLGVISVAGLGGVVAGYKRGVVRKLAYSTIGLTSAACLCYPNQVSNAAKYSAGAVTDQSKKLWHSLTTPAVVEPEVPQTELKLESLEKAPSPKVVQSAPSSSETFAKVTIEAPSQMIDLKEQPEPAKDFGQSSKEDDDLYTTRG